MPGFSLGSPAQNLDLPWEALAQLAGVVCMQPGDQVLSGVGGGIEPSFERGFLVIGSDFKGFSTSF